MTDSPTTEVVDTEEVDDDKSPKPLREALKRSEQREAKYKAMAYAGAYEKAGLDPTKGLGKAIAKEYDGEPDVEAVLAFAKEEYDYEPKAGDHPQQAKIDTEQGKLDDANTSSSSPDPLTESEALRKASADGDKVAAGNIKAAKLRRIMNPTN